MLNYVNATELTKDYLEQVWSTLPQFVRTTLLLPCPVRSLSKIIVS